MDAQIARIVKEGVADEELARVKTGMLSDLNNNMESFLNRADSLAIYQALWGDAKVVNQVPGKIESVTSEDIKRVAAKYLTAKSKISFKSKDQDIDNANVSMRMRKDSILWLQIVVGPIEVVRGIITRDSIQIIDRHNKAYYQYDFASLSQKFNFLWTIFNRH